MEVAQFCSTSHVVIVAGKGGVGKTTVTAALATAAARAGSSVLVVEIEGKSGLATMFGVAGPLVRRARPRFGYSRPLSHPRRRARRLPRVARDAPDLEAAHRLGGAGGRRDRGAGDEGHPRAGQGEVARRDAHRRPDHRRRARGRPRHLVPPVAARSARRGAGRPDQQAGCRRRASCSPIRSAAR